MLFRSDDETLRYLELTGRPEDQIALVASYAGAQGLFHHKGDKDAEYSDLLELDLKPVWLGCLNCGCILILSTSSWGLSWWSLPELGLTMVMLLPSSSEVGLTRSLSLGLPAALPLVWSSVELFFFRLNLDSLMESLDLDRGLSSVWDWLMLAVSAISLILS